LGLEFLGTLISWRQYYSFG